MNKWHVYSYLKRTNGRATTRELIQQFPSISANELAEGIREYNLMAHDNPDYYQEAK